MSFDYLIDKIQEADFREAPFKHIYIEDFFSDDHFREISQSSDLLIEEPQSDKSLFEALYSHGYKIIGFPGCITDEDKYIKWHKSKNPRGVTTNTACAGFGIALRLYSIKTSIISDLNEFITSDGFNLKLAEKFDIDFAATHHDGGIQKYLDGYEISPHPDIRKKALTFMVNVNPAAMSSELEYHTHYLEFNDRYRFIKNFWAGNPGAERCWVPWHWCESKFKQSENNSIVIFSPSNDTLHAVKASYDHLRTQRTQLYGNLWYNDVESGKDISWEDLDIYNNATAKPDVVAKMKQLVPHPIKKKIRALQGREGRVVADRLSDT